LKQLRMSDISLTQERKIITYRSQSGEVDGAT
jgi:hypothetical protein